MPLSQYEIALMPQMKAMLQEDQIILAQKLKQPLLRQVDVLHNPLDMLHGLILTCTTLGTRM